MPSVDTGSRKQEGDRETRESVHMWVVLFD